VSQTASPPHPVQRKRKSGGMGLDRGDSGSASGLPPAIRRVPRLSLCRGNSWLPVYPCPCRDVKVVLDVVRAHARGHASPPETGEPTRATARRVRPDSAGVPMPSARPKTRRGPRFSRNYLPIFRCKGPGKPLV
jgi:hypothetical protein